MKAYVVATIVTVAAMQPGSVAGAPTGASPEISGVKVGLEVIEAEKGGFLNGRKVGLIAHAASVTVDGRHAIDVLRGAGINVVRIYAPERAVRVRGALWDKVPHNLDGTPWHLRPQAPGGALNWVDIGTGLPIVGLFGDKAWLKPVDLEGIDALVYDLQDAGTRQYTNAGVLILAMDAAASAGIEIVVLDRPNPLGGDLVEGPEADVSGPKATRLTNVPPGPLISGLTLGELARFANARRTAPGRLRVVAMKGWRRDMLWPDTRRPWPVPSPNLRTFEAAMAYSGVGLVEATTLSEGRGTEAPFLLLGAPGLQPDPLAAISAPGFKLARATFTPRPSATAPRPKHANQECLGVKVEINEPSAARPYEMGIALLHALRAQKALQWQSPTALDELLGTSKVRLALERGDSVASIVGSHAAAIENFKRNRTKSLLY